MNAMVDVIGSRENDALNFIRVSILCASVCILLSLISKTYKTLPNNLFQETEFLVIFHANFFAVQCR